jgi:DNA-binding CsgD family transcriptional regulator
VLGPHRAAHLTHIYAKLGLSSRTELAAETTRQQS